MDAMNFLQGIFAFAAGHNYAKKIEAESDEVPGPDLPDGGRAVWEKAKAADQEPRGYITEKHGWVVTHIYDEGLRYACGSQDGPGPYSAAANIWWKAETDADKPGSLLNRLGVDGSGWTEEGGEDAG